MATLHLGGPGVVESIRSAAADAAGNSGGGRGTLRLFQ
eukprot:gene21230-47554_t